MEITKETQIKKILDKVFNFLCMFIIAIITVSLTSKNVNDAADKEKINKKLDKTEFTERKIEVDKELDKKVDQKEFDMSQKNMDLFIKNQLVIQEDIKKMLPKIE